MTNNQLMVDILDNHFSHNDCSSGPWQSNKNFQWNFNPNQKNDVIIFTDNSLNKVDSFHHKRKIAWLLESPVITSQSYEYIKSNFEKFDFIFTFSKELLKISDKFLLCPFGGCWIYPEHFGIHHKDKLVSIILSNKNQTEGQSLRQLCKPFVPVEDTFLPQNNNYIYKKDSLEKYMFSIVVENCKEDYYFTEKLIDCFVMGTVPIYWGCPSISDFFDINGIITFNSLEELDNIIKNLNDDEYKKRYDSILKNFEISKKYTLCEDFIYNNYKDLLTL